MARCMSGSRREVAFEAQGRYLQHLSGLWWLMNSMDIIFIFVTLSRLPLFHEYTWAQL